MAEEVGKVGNGKVEGSEEKGKNKPVVAKSIPTTNGFLNISVWDGGRVSLKVTRKNEDGEWETVWTARINAIDFLHAFKELEEVRDVVRDEVKKLLGESL